MRHSLYIILYVIGLTLLPVNFASAQDNNTLRDIYTQAENDYQVGRLEQALELLKANANDFQGNLRQNAYRLISICYLAQDSLALSEYYASLLLRENPYYTSVQDPIRFEDMVNRLKMGNSTTVTTASSKAESLEEVPVPVTIVTKEMIEAVGSGKSLNQILALYVPGMTEVAAASMDNIAMHGVYTSAQEKILVMENGHRLNIRSTNNGKMDYSINTDKIERIEVLRGPASSLYGNVALTAVVNIITRKGADIDGVSLKYGGGSFGTHKASLLAGTRFYGADILAWASIYTSQGQEIYYGAGEGYSKTKHDGHAFVDRYSGTPSHDIGLTMNLNHFDLMMSHKLGKKVQQYSHYGELYDYDSYRTFNGLKPGYAVESTHTELDYHTEFGNVSLSLSAYGDWYSTTDYSVVSDSTNSYIFDLSGNPMIDDDGNPYIVPYRGLSQNANWKEYALGGVFKMDFDYRIGSMKGNVLMGSMFEYFTLTDSYSLLGDDYDMVLFVLPERKNYILTGHENYMSAFMQCKHQFTSKLIANVGLRYDHKHRKNNIHVDALSPRLALIWMPRKTLSLKLSYSRAFVDAPFFYRQNTSNTYRGSEDLTPEYMNAVQLNIFGTLPRTRLNYDLNLYYNVLTDIINNRQDKQVSSVKYRNSGRLKMMGAEAGLNYTERRLEGHLSLSWQHAIDAEDYYYSDHNIYAIPSLTMNMNLSYKLLNKAKHELWLSGNLHAYNKALIPASTTIPGSQPFYLPGKAVTDVVLRYRYNRNVQLGVECSNLFDTERYIGGTTYIPYQQLGRSVMATLAYTFL